MDDEFAGIDGPLMGRLVPIAESTGIQAESDVFGFAWSEPDFLKSLQLALGALGLGGWIGDIKLGDFRSGHAAGIGYVEADRDGGARCGRGRNRQGWRS